VILNAPDAKSKLIIEQTRLNRNRMNTLQQTMRAWPFTNFLAISPLPS